MALTRAQLAALIAANLPNNVSRLITPAKHREVEDALTEAAVNIEDDIVVASTGAADAGKIPSLDGAGLLDPSVIPGGGGGVVGNTIFVEIHGNDITGNGSQSNPLATVQAAYALIEANADASRSNPYVVKVGPGLFTGATLAILPWTWLEGHAGGHNGVNTFPSGAGTVAGGPTILDFNVVYDAVFSTAGNVACGVANIALNDIRRFVFELGAIGGTAGSLTQIRNCYAANEHNVGDGKFTWVARGRADVLVVDGLRSPSQAHITDGTIFLENAYLNGGLSFGHTTAGGTKLVVLKNCYIIGNAAMQGDPSNAANVTIVAVGTAFSNGWTQTGFGTYLSDAVSLPRASLNTYSGNWTVTLINDANGSAFTPTTSGNWPGTDPVTVQEALDQLASRTLTGPVTAAAGLGATTLAWEIQVACSDLTTAITSGTNKMVFRMPFAATLTAVRASVNTAPTGANLVIDINESGSTILSTKLSIDAGEKTSTTAATPPVISDSALADDAEITIDFDQVGSTIAGAGVIVTLIGTRTA